MRGRKTHARMYRFGDLRVRRSSPSFRKERLQNCIRANECAMDFPAPGGRFSGTVNPPSGFPPLVHVTNSREAISSPSCTVSYTRNKSYLLICIIFVITSQYTSCQSICWKSVLYCVSHNNRSSRKA